MNPQIKKVIYYIERHLDSVWQVEQLAQVAGYSPYHFCRIFKIHIGESAISYATRLKLERAAREMMLEQKSMIEIALDAGYQTPTGFLKAFKQRFGTTPSNYQEGSKITLNRYKEIKMNTPKIVTRDAVDVIFTRELGEYEKSSDIAWKRLSGQLNRLGEQFETRPPNSPMNLAPGKAEALGICHDDPKVTDEKNIRYDAALAWDKEDVAELQHYGFETKSVAGGKYAMVEYLGDANGEAAWYGLYAWVEAKGHTFRNAPAFEKYLNGVSEKDPKKLEVEVYVPIV
jgi:AraC family transcriptional regulator